MTNRPAWLLNEENAGHRRRGSVAPTASHPMQPVELDENGVARFKANTIIDHLFDTGKLDLNAIARLDFPTEDRIQLAQLLGYSVSGFSDLSYATDDTVTAAEEAVTSLLTDLETPPAPTLETK